MTLVYTTWYNQTHGDTIIVPVAYYAPVFIGEVFDGKNPALQSCHSHPTSGHFGITKTWHRLAERFYWKGLCKDVKNMVGNVLNEPGRVHI